MKKLAILTFIFCCTFLSIPHTKALEVNDSGYINTKGVLFYSEPNFQGNQVLDTLDTGDKVKLLDKNIIASNDSTRCSNGFYKVSFYWESYNKKTYNGYVCANNIDFQIDTSKYEEEFSNNNIPKIYWEKLALLKSTHPNWKFTGYNTNLDWNNVIENESVVGISYIQSTNPIYLSLDDGSYDPATNTYIQREAGGWYAANKKTVAYYMDPRNFLDEINIFMFENLGYNPESQTKEVVENIFSGTDLLQYSDYYMQAATYDGNNISPISLAARSRQEVVLPGGKLSDSANGQGKINDVVYYNFYNIGAFSTCSNPIECALDFAKGYDENYTTYDRPWTTPEKAILNGAKYIADGYINVGQNTLYFERWNVTNRNTFSHQYMTNISAPLSEAISSYNAYNNIGKLDSKIEFLIPVYNNMPNEASALPTAVEQKKIEEIKESTTFSNVINKSGYNANNGYISGIKIGTTATHMITAIKVAGGEATITSDGKNISGSEVLGTGDIVNIKVNDETKSYRIVINGDVNGDGKVDSIDFVRIYKVMSNETNLSGSYALAADTNHDGKVDSIDFVKVYKYMEIGSGL